MILMCAHLSIFSRSGDTLSVLLIFSWTVLLQTFVISVIFFLVTSVYTFQFSNRDSLGHVEKLEKEFNLTVFWKCWLRLLESYSGVFFSKAFVYSLLLPTFLFRRFRATKSALTLAFPSLSFGSALIRSPLKMKWGSTTWRWRRSSSPCCLPGIRDPESESASRTSNWPQSCPTQSYAERSGSDRISPLTS